MAKLLSQQPCKLFYFLTSWYMKSNSFLSKPVLFEFLLLAAENILTDKRYGHISSSGNPWRVLNQLCP